MANDNNTVREEQIQNVNLISPETPESCSTLIQQGFAALMPTIRASNSLPKGEQRDIFCASPLFNPIMDALGNKALDLMTTILHHQGMYRDIRKRDIEEKTELVIDANDKILERVNIYLDELSGIRRNPSQSKLDSYTPLTSASGSWNREVSKSAAWKEIKLTRHSKTPIVLRGGITHRPQLKFMDKIDNSSTPFDPRIKEKPNALKPLAVLLENIPNEDPCYSHPYEFELDRFQERIELLNLSPRKLQKPKAVEETTLLMITQKDQLLEMIEELRSQKEIAVDLEHHSYRSFQGFTCLMQISTREKDYIIDTLDLRHELYVLNEIFTDPKIVKVFHGADSDIQWLQRDLCLYVVNMFDTYQAALMLSLPRLSLAFLLKSFCNIDANKNFQLYDWRTRPLAKEAIKYAREDTHYLLYIYDVLWNRLLDKSNGGTQLLQSVIFRSADTCKKRYWKFIFKEDSYEGMYRQSKKNFDNRQLYALKELYAWRDKIAREEDESVGFTLPNHMLLLIAEKLPKEVQGILACCNPIPSLVRQNVVMLHQIILKAREQPLIVRPSASLSNETRVRPTQPVGVNLEGALHCPHDLTHNEDFRDDLPTLLNSTSIDSDAKMDCGIELLEDKPALPVFEKLDEVKSPTVSKGNFSNQIHFMSPFERYKKMLLYIDDEEKKSKEEKEKEIARDTQKLLDECMRERLAASNRDSVKTMEIKQESESGGHNSRKRNRSQANINSDNEEDSKLSVPVKEETSSNEFIHRNKMSKKDKIYEEFKSKVLKSTPLGLKVEVDSPIVDEYPPKKKRKNGNNRNQITTMAVGPNQDMAGKNRNNTSQNKNNKNLSENFTQFDYSKVDYSQYQLPAAAQTPKTSTEKFKPKGKKKHQNKMFTFARQYGGANNKKK